jgi:hypothetical protein
MAEPPQIREGVAYRFFSFCAEYSSREDMEEAMDTLDGTELDGARECTIVCVSSIRMCRIICPGIE